MFRLWRLQLVLLVRVNEERAMHVFEHWIAAAT